MKISAVLAFSIVALCLMESYVSALPPRIGKLKADLREVEHIERRKLAARIKPEADLKEVEHIETQMDSQLPVPANIDKALDPCRGKWTEFEESCYHVDDTIKSWSQAQAYCRGLKANLVKINSLQENEFVLDLVRKHAPKVNQVWMGLQWVDGADPKAFYWFDDSVPTFRNWAPGEPNNSAKGYCVQMYVGGHHNELATHASGYWNDNRCDHPDEPSAIVCKRLY